MKNKFNTLLGVIGIVYLVVASLPLFKNLHSQIKYQVNNNSNKHEWVEEPMLIEEL